MKKYLNLIVLLISLVTVISGLTQLLVPKFILGIVGAEINATTAHFFAIVGMFMTLFGGMMIQTVYSSETGKAAILWSALQKLGASTAVILGFARGIFAFQALGVAAFDLISGIIFIYYLQQRIRGENS